MSVRLVFGIIRKYEPCVVKGLITIWELLSISNLGGKHYCVLHYYIIDIIIIVIIIIIIIIIITFIIIIFTIIVIINVMMMMMIVFLIQGKIMWRG